MTIIGTLAVTAFIFLHTGTLDLENIALAYLTINGGQSIGSLGKGGMQRLQGGSTAPDQIIAPVQTKDVTAPLEGNK